MMRDPDGLGAVMGACSVGSLWLGGDGVGSDAAGL